MPCPGCGAASARDTDLCNQCAGRSTRACSSCFAANPLRARFCGQCAATLHTADADAADSAGERRHIAVLFCDIVSSASLSTRLDPEDLREVLREYQARCSDVVRAHDGHIAQYLGDGLLVYFGYPRAHENNTLHAARAGLAILRAVSQLRTGGIQLRVRIAVHCGMAVLDTVGDQRRRDWLAIGRTPAIAMALQAEAPPDSVVLSEAAARRTAGFLELDDIGARTRGGSTAGPSLYRVIAETAAYDRLDAIAPTALPPLLDRAAELELLTARWRAAVNGMGSAVAVCGEPGIGKSRLVCALRAQIASEAARVVVCHASSLFRTVPLHPIVQMLARILGAEPEGTPETNLQRLELELARSGADPSLLQPLAALLRLPLSAASPAEAVSERGQRRDALLAILEWFNAAARQRPLLLVFEDIHWADPSTLELIGMLLDRGPVDGLLLVLTHRPELELPWRSPRLQSLALGRLPLPSAQQLLAAVRRDVPLPPELESAILAKAGGVPLYVEEITKAVLVTASAGPRALGGSHPPAPHALALPIPVSLLDSLTSRLDRLGSARAVIQLAATLGMTFSFQLLRAVSGLDERELLHELERLVAAQLLSRSDEGANAGFTFRDGLIRDAAYESLLHSTRRRHHLRISEVLSERFPNLVAADPELLAKHRAAAALHPDASVAWQLASREPAAHEGTPAPRARA